MLVLSVICNENWIMSLLNEGLNINEKEVNEVTWIQGRIVGSASEESENNFLHTCSRNRWKLSLIFFGETPLN